MKWIEIFKTGTWTSSQGKTKTWTEKDLDAIVAKFNPEQKPPVTVGHPENDRAPAYGWMTALKREGGKLLAQFKFVDEFLELLKKGIYKNRSIGLRDGAIDHVAFLGGVAPAVKGLEEIEFSAEEAETEYYETNLTKECQMDEETKKRLEALEAENAKMKADFAASQKELEEAKAEKGKMEAEKRKNELDQFCDKLVTDGKMTPALCEEAKKLFGGFCEDEKNFEKGGVVETFKEFLGKMPDQKQLEKNIANKKDAKNEKGEEPTDYHGMAVDEFSVMLDKKATEIMESRKVDYDTAAKLAIKEIKEA